MTNITTNITSDKGFEKSHQSGRTEGPLVGISSGISVSGALELAKRPENKGKKFVVILSENNGSNLSADLYIKGEVKTKAPDLFWSF